MRVLCPGDGRREPRALLGPAGLGVRGRSATLCLDVRPARLEGGRRGPPEVPEEPAGRAQTPGAGGRAGEAGSEIGPERG